MTEAEERALIHSFVEAAWCRFPAYHVIQDDSSQRKALAGLRRVHQFPDAAEVLGEPVPHHYSPGGGLVTARKAHFLLFGCFEWRGMKVTYQHGTYTWDKKLRPARWLATTEMSQVADIPPYETLRDFIYLSRRYVWKPFEEAAAELGVEGPQRIRKPRVLKCAVCSVPMISKNSVRRKHQGAWLRLCFECDRGLRMTKALSGSY